MPRARQLCRASQTIAAQSSITACPVCGRAVEATDHQWVIANGERTRHPIVPSHVADPDGEIRVSMRAAAKKYPGAS